MTVYKVTAGLSLILMLCLQPLDVLSKSSIDFGLGMMQGHTTYSIGGDAKWDDSGVIKSGYIHDPLSRLEFSLDVHLAQLGLVYEFDDRWVFSGDYSFNLTKNTDKMKDSDWGIDGDSSDTLSIYSESDSELTATIVNLEGFYKLGEERNLKIFVGGAFLYEYFDYEISNTDQYSPSGLSGYDQEISGKTLEYNIAYWIYSIAGKLEIEIEKVTLSGGFQYALSAAAKDYDNHVLRDKISTSETSGSAYSFFTGAIYQFRENNAVELRYTYRYMDLSGIQTQKTNGVWSAEIDNKITSKQELIVINFKLLF